MKSKILFSLSILSILFIIGCVNIEKPIKESVTPNNNQSVADKDKVDEDLSSNDKADQNASKEDESKKTAEDTTPLVENRKSRIYAFNREDLTLYYYDTTIEVTDNALVSALTKELQTNLPSDKFIALTDKSNITSATLDKDKSLLTIVFSDSYVDNMLLGSSTESGLLSSLICTYGYNYGVDNIAIYFNDTLYTSLKGDLEDGYFKVDYSNSKEYIK